MSPMIRWLLVIPAALAAMFAVQLLVVVGNLLTMNAPVFLVELFIMITASGFGGFAFVAAGSRVAPNNHFVTAVVLATLLGCFHGFGAFLSLANGSTDGLFPGDLVLSFLLAVMGGIAAATQLKDHSPG